MFVYELAIELDRRSSELVDAAAALGFGPLTASSELSPAQVHQLRTRVAGPAGPAPMPGPAAFAPPSAEPDPGPALAPPPPPPAGSPSTSSPPSFVPPVAFEPVASGALTFGDPATALPPPPPPPPGPVAAAPHRPSASGPGGFSRGQLVAIGTVVVLVVGLFGFMIATSGPDEARERAIAAGEVEDARAPDEATATTAATTTAAPTTTVVVDQASPVDVATFCEGGVPLLLIQSRLLVAAYDGDLGELQDLSRERRAEWEASLDKVSVGGPPMYVDEVERYQRGVTVWLDALLVAATQEDAYAAAGGIEVERALNAGDEFLRQVNYYCD